MPDPAVVAASGPTRNRYAPSATTCFRLLSSHLLRLETLTDNEMCWLWPGLSVFVFWNPASCSRAVSPLPAPGGAAYSWATVVPAGPVLVTSKPTRTVPSALGSPDRPGRVEYLKSV